MEFEEIGNEERKLLLNAFGYDVNDKGVIVDSLLGTQMISKETKRPILLENAGLIPGSLDIIDTTPLTISKFLREKIELKENGS